MDPVARSHDLQAQSSTLAEWLAATEEMVAETLSQRAMTDPDRAAYLLAQSEEARAQAARWRQH